MGDEEINLFSPYLPNPLSPYRFLIIAGGKHEAGDHFQLPVSNRGGAIMASDGEAALLG